MGVIVTVVILRGSWMIVKFLLLRKENVMNAQLFRWFVMNVNISNGVGDR